jgi:alanine racemase
MYDVRTITEAVHGERVSSLPEQRIRQMRIAHLVTDTRKIMDPAGSVFFALQGPKRDGHQFIAEAFQQGVRCFVVTEVPEALLEDTVWIRVADSMQALQDLAVFHRSRFHYPVIGITGSNGKTVVKEWLNHLLEKEMRIVRSPRSYNSQVGVPLSIWQMTAEADLGIFEAGISTRGEMRNLEQIIRPTLGVFTNIGDAHSEGFGSTEEKIAEKLGLFPHARALVFCADDEQVSGQLRTFAAAHGIETLCWGRTENADLRLLQAEAADGRTVVRYRYRGAEHSFTIPYTDGIAVQNAMTCATVLTFLSRTGSMAERMADLPPISMRLEMRNGINRCTVINDSYSADIYSLRMALDFLRQQKQHPKHTLILSDLLQSAKDERRLYGEIANLVRRYGIDRFIGIGPVISSYSGLFTDVDASFHASTQDFVSGFTQSSFHNEAILLKGARAFAFERIDRLFENQWHQTVLQVDLSAIADNLTAYRSMLNRGTRIMVMVKAFSYGSGSYEIANLLQFHKVDHLAVAYADEGVELRRAGIHLPIMVMNPEEATFASLVDHDLQPEIFSFGMLGLFSRYLQKEGVSEFPVHLKIDTGMHRLGFLPDEIDELLRIWPSSMHVVSVFTHLVGSEDPGEDAFTRQQAETFREVCERLEKGLGHGFLRHLSNTAAISRHRDLQMDMVRLGIGLYGVNTTGTSLIPLREAAVLTTTVAQVKLVKAGETVGYNRKGKLLRDSRVATLRIGYADGYPMSLSNGRGKVMIRNRLFPVIGNVCMDMTMVDVTDMPGIQEGEEVIVFGKGLDLKDLASWAGTIPYEIMTGISQRVKRVYYGD